uniref:FHA domain-containing protein n=1 Tax=Corethron hystrix TaxID=216773 RepID=A0A7S1BZ48_9STRA|mmetsp:Transcript_6287/g.13611  ORF Transcript_6287/g.13611 Transcript_6287/m.13611 type:complete len:296 (+) Transcript_6287:275-1162(+)|eukprot:CAMPEP_0113315846 /NCGR_PEP_ID=MMETSP0010_2-20120614/11351_1 /TAXON_ID=216773 ORGANISM="Corethron hystrix, Strain 308" /NCGR_SAMPLE_ID=MMETSP0010_2 /ASSEMBLY_ACC=CAM_ASM_000155 /LENGTH=295 /DNA_ID=CAMNT_0000172429 /DNA_START=150 /DNA_END=1037 /DNA_ORIENTATION=+ /assembly_acc=CAM_ASM_000155
MEHRRKRSRWGDKEVERNDPGAIPYSPSRTVSHARAEAAATAALIADAERNSAAPFSDKKDKRRPPHDDEVRRPPRRYQHRGDNPSRNENVAYYSASESVPNPVPSYAADAPPNIPAPPAEKPNFNLSGALANDPIRGTIDKKSGCRLKYVEPTEARVPTTRWRLYVFKKNHVQNGNADDDDGLIETLHISRQSAYLIGRDGETCDILAAHPSLSNQHCAVQFRAVPSPSDQSKLVCRPYLIDLGSTNGTYINGKRLEDSRYYELKRMDVLTLGRSTREYVVLTEKSAGTAALPK